jgi:AcrR family transcriptional regulator
MGQAPLGQAPRRRLMDALALAAAEKGYAAVTIADIVGPARVSKRTFYEHFADKEECLLALYEDTCDDLMRVLLDATVPPDQPWPDRVRAFATAYLGALERLPVINRTLLLEMQAAGARAYRLRAQTQQRFADLLCKLVEEGRQKHPEVRPLPPLLALAIVGGINELMLHAVDPHLGPVPEQPFTALLDPVTELVTAVLTPAPDHPGRS